MKHYVSESRAKYEDLYHGQFSHSLAEWAISRMMKKDPTSEKLTAIKATPLEETMKALKENGVEIEKSQQYTAWYLYNMAKADYPKALATDAQRASFVEETLCDPDGSPEAVLECFTAKMCSKGVPIFWEEFL